MISPARTVAHAVLSRVEQGGWAQELLLSEASTLDSRDAGLASEIVYGCLRRQAQLDHLIEVSSGRSVQRLDRAVRVALRMGVYQLRHLDRVPAHAVVNESVELVKRARKRSAASFVNAVLRKIPTGEFAWPSRAIAFSEPEWLLNGWDREFGPEVADAIGTAFLQPAETFVRNPPPRPGLKLEPTDVPGAFRVISGDTAGLRIQDVGSQSIVPLLDLHPGMRFLDICAAPGNKTAQALEAGVTGIACDIHLHRLRTVSGCARVALDAAAPLPFRDRFDRILVDAPCSGTGTLGRNPEIRWRIQPSDLRELHERQVRILKNGLDHLAPGGRLVYSTCSLERIENEDVLTASGIPPADARNIAGEGAVLSLGARVSEVLRRTPGKDAGDGFFAAVITLE